MAFFVFGSLVRIFLLAPPGRRNVLSIILGSLPALPSRREKVVHVLVNFLPIAIMGLLFLSREIAPMICSSSGVLASNAQHVDGSEEQLGRSQSPG